MFTNPARISSPAAQRRTRRVRAQLPSTLRSTGHVAPAGRVATTAGDVGVSVSGLATARSRKDPPGSGVSASDEPGLDHLERGQLHPRAAPHGHERAGEPEAGRPRPHHLHAAARVGVEADAHHRELGGVGVPRHEPGVPLGGDEARGALAGRGVVTSEPGSRTDLGPGQGMVDAQHRGQRHDGGHDRDEDHDDPQAHEPAGGVVLQHALDTGEEGDEPEREGGEERDAQPPDPAHDLAVEQPRPDHLPRVRRLRQPRQAVQEAAGLDDLVELREHLAHDVVPGRCVDRRPGIDERVVRVVLVAVHDVHLLRPGTGVEGEVDRQREPAGPEPLPDDLDQVRVPGDVAVVVAGQHHHVVVLAGGEGLHGVGPLVVGVEDLLDRRDRRVELLEPVARDHEDARTVPRGEHADQLVGAPLRRLRSRSR